MAYIVKAVFGSESIVKTDTIYQYNSGQVLQVEGLAFTNSTEFHLAIHGKDTASIITGTIANNIAKITIPEVLMINDFCTCNYRIDVFVYVIDNDSGYTKYKIIIPVKSRPRPKDYYVDLPTVPELKSLKQELNTAVNNFNDAYTEIDQLKSETASLKEEIDNVENDNLTVFQGYNPVKLIPDKFLTSSGIAGYTGWSATENIKVDGLDYIYTEWSKASSYNKFLDSNFGLVKMVGIKDGLQKTNVPEGASYVAFSNETTVMEGLRVWSPTKANSYENTLEISKLKQDIPFYYENHLTDKITEVRAKEAFSGVNGDEFIFITDYHMERNANNSPSLIDKIIHQTGAKKIVFGGDAYDASSTSDLALNKIADFYSMFYENADKILSCIGNHEYNNPASNKPEQQIPNGQVYASIVNRNNLIHHSGYTGNYTILNRSNETMYIFIGCEYSSSITNESIKYVLETIKNNYGYNIIVFSHVGLDNGGDNGNVANITNGFKRITDGIDKFNQKSNYIFDGITYDYSGCTGEVICVFSGHNHVDGCIRTEGGLNVISTTCDAYGAPEGGVVRTKGTITEQAFDVVNIDYENKKIYMTRIGAGEDRVFSYS